MRHRVSGRKLNRSTSHRRSLLRSLSTELIRHKRITTTEAKAKEAGRFVEAIISRAKRAYIAERDGGPLNLHARRLVGRDIQDEGIVSELFANVAPKVADRPGGYTRVVRIGRRNGDAAEMAILELVDYNSERDESAVRSRSKNLMSRAERVRRSQEKQKEAEEKTVEAASETAEVVEEVEETVEAAADDVTKAETSETEVSSENSDSDADTSDTASEEKTEEK